jgi:hypothetical protein
MVGTIICEVGTIIYDIGTINVKFYLLKARYPHGTIELPGCEVYWSNLLQAYN